MKPRIVRGRATATLGYDLLAMTMAPEQRCSVVDGAVYQLVPDDGTYKVVSVEEWEQHEACETFARWAYDSLCAGDLDLDMLDIQEKLAALGLVEERPVNPDENEWGADMLFFWKTDPPSATTPGGESHEQD